MPMLPFFPPQNSYIFPGPGDHQSALFALLFAQSLFWHIMHWLTRKQANDKTQLSASFPWGMQNCKQMTRLNSLHPSLGACKTANKWQDSTLCILPLGHAKLQTKAKKKQKKNIKNNPMSEALWPSRSSWFSCFFFGGGFADLWPTLFFFWLLVKFCKTGLHPCLSVSWSLWREITCA